MVTGFQAPNRVNEYLATARQAVLVDRHKAAETWEFELRRRGQQSGESTVEPCLGGYCYGDHDLPSELDVPLVPEL